MMGEKVESDALTAVECHRLRFSSEDRGADAMLTL